VRLLRAAALLMLLPAVASADSLGQAAAKEQERRKQNEKNGTKAPVITEEELKNNKGQLANDPNDPSAIANQAASSRSSRGSTAPVSAPTGRDEQAWRARAAQARARLDQATKTYEALNRQYLAPGEYFVSKKTGQTVVRDREQLQQMVAQAKAAMLAAQKALDDLEESARRQNIPPGWLR
jgi:hypothetical protein